MYFITVMCMDILLNMRRTYIYKGQIIRDKKKVFYNYLRKFFAWDIVIYNYIKISFTCLLVNYTVD